MNQLNTKLTAIAFALSINFSAVAAENKGGMDHSNMQGSEAGNGEMQNTGMENSGMQQSGGMQNSMAGKHCSLKLNANQFEAQELSEEVTNDLRFMREEEKLARDVYQALYVKWFSMVHGNIADAEQMHMDRIKIFLDAYGVEDSASEEVGVFNNETLQSLYDDLVAQGLESELEAYKVGAYVEEVDINDLENSIKNTDIQELKEMYMQLKNSSYMHLRKFNESIVALGGEYVPQVLSQDAFDAILNAQSSMMMGMGNGVRVTADGDAGTKACFVSSLMADEQALQAGSVINADQAVNISYQVDVDASDMGKAGEWVIVASYMPSAGAPASWYVRDGQQWQVWDGKLDNLSAAMSSDELPVMQEVLVFDGVLGSMTGEYSIYAGYRVEDTGLVYNPLPLNFSVQP